MKLALRQTQRLVMTPLLQQAIQLLQLSTLELEQVVRKELEENPLLEEVPAETAETAEAPAAASASPEAVEAPVAPPAEPPSKETSSVDAERADDLPFDLPAALFDDLEPAHVSERLGCLGDRVQGGIAERLGGGADQLDFLVDGVCHGNSSLVLEAEGLERSLPLV